MATAEKLQIDVVLRDLASKGFATIGSGIANLAKAPLRAVSSLTSAVFSLRGALIGAAGILSARQIVKFVTDTSSAADKLKDLNTELGVSTEFLSEVGFAASQAGVGVDGLADGIRFLQKAIGEFRTTGRGPIEEIRDFLSADAINSINSGRAVEETFHDIADSIRELGAAEKVFVSSKLFGRGAGSGFIKLFSQDLEAARREAKALGLTITEDAANAADVFEDAIGRLKASLVGLRNNAILPLLPQLTEGLDNVSSWISTNRPTILRFLADVTEGSGDMFRTLSEGLGSIVDVGEILQRFRLGRAADEVRRLTQELEQGREIILAVDGDLRNASGLREVERDLVRAKETLKEAQEAYSAFQGLQRGDLSRTIQEAAKRAAEALRESAAAQAQALGQIEGPEILREQEAGIRALQALQEHGVPHITQLLRAQLGVRLEDIQALEEQREQNAKLTREEQDRIIQAKEAAFQRENAYRQEHDALRGLSAAFRQMQEESIQYGRIAADSALQIRDSLASNLTDSIIDFANGTKTAKEAFRDLARSVLQDIQRIIVKQLVLLTINKLLGGFGGSVTSTGGAAKGGVFGGHLEPVRGHMATGGVARERGLYELREAGKNEAVVPLPDNRSIPVKILGGQGRGSGGGLTINQVFNFSYNFATPADERRLIERNARQIADAVVRANNSSLAVHNGLKAA